MKRLSALLQKYRAILAYLFFGGCTTLLNMGIYALCYDLLAIPNLPADLLAWFFSVLFAYVTNKLFVFESRSFARSVLVQELLSFFGCRLFTGLLDLGIMYVAVDRLELSPHLWKLLSNVIVILLNYGASKLLIFRRPGGRR